MSAPTASVIVSTYNQPGLLQRCLAGFAHQDRADFELIVVDDGSGDETRALIEMNRAKLPFTLSHAWQEDQGFRKCRALNLGILAARSDYLVFTDGDCVPRHDFVSAHLRLREPGRFLGGGYCKLPQDVSTRIDDDAIAQRRHCDLDWLIAQGLPRRQRSLKLWSRAGWRETLLNATTPTRPRWSGNNASGWRVDLMHANGFDERMTYGGEDLELGERLENAGVRGKQVRFAAICVHLDHPRGYVEPGMRAANERIRATTRATRATRTAFGLDLHQHVQTSTEAKGSERY